MTVATLAAGVPGGSYRSCEHSSITTTLNLYRHQLPSTDAALVDAVDAVLEQCDEADEAAAAQGS
jgi:hypothetical protein